MLKQQIRAQAGWSASGLLILALFGGFISGSPCGAQEAESAVKARLDAVAQSHTPGNTFMGSVLVADGDRVLLNKGYGMARVEWNIPNAPDVKFRIASLTKQFTAALILLLQQDGRLRIEDTAGKYLPNAPAHWARITLAELLGHTSGIPDLTTDI